MTTEQILQETLEELKAVFSRMNDKLSLAEKAKSASAGAAVHEILNSEIYNYDAPGDKSRYVIPDSVNVKLDPGDYVVRLDGEIMVGLQGFGCGPVQYRVTSNEDGTIYFQRDARTEIEKKMYPEQLYITPKTFPKVIRGADLAEQQQPTLSEAQKQFQFLEIVLHKIDSEISRHRSSREMHSELETPLGKSLLNGKEFGMSKIRILILDMMREVPLKKTEQDALLRSQ